MTKKTWSTIIAPHFRRTTGEAGMAFSWLYGTIPTGVKSFLEWEASMYKSNAAMRDIRYTSRL
eukprot:1540090-Pyramimonas_sp.AAC.1